MNKILGPRAIVLDPNKATVEIALRYSNKRVRAMLDMQEALNTAAGLRAAVATGGPGSRFDKTDHATGLKVPISPVDVVKEAERLEERAMAIHDQLVVEAINAAMERSLKTQRPKDVAEFVAAFAGRLIGQPVANVEPIRGQTGGEDPTPVVIDEPAPNSPADIGYGGGA